MPANNRRKLLRLDVTDAEKRRFPSKHYSYVIKVCWTDDSETVIYRRYSKFFEFQIILLETFPYEGGLKEPSARIIPFLPGKILFRRSHVRDVAMKRLKPIDEYCKGLVRLPPHISESDHVLDFFETKPEDLNPIRDEGSRRKRREDQVSKQGSLSRSVRPVRRTRSLDIGEISGPILLEQYLAIADYTSTQNKELTIMTGQHLEVIEKNENGWWFVSNDEGERGWVPGVYLERPDGSPEDLVTNQAELGQGEHYITIQSYNAETSEEISFGAGVTVEVLQKNLEGWWLVSYQGRQGYAPASYLEKTHDWVRESVRRPVEIIPSIRDLKHRHSLPANNLSTIAFPSQQILKSSNVTPDTSDTAISSSDFKSAVSRYSKEKTVQPPPKRSSVKRFTKKRPEGPPPLPPLASAEPTYEYMTIAPFNASVPDGVSFSEEKHVEVLEKSPGGWWFIQIDGDEGWAPASYIEKRETAQKAKAAPSRPGPPKLSKNNSSGKIELNGNSSPTHKVALSKTVSQPQPAKMLLPTSRSQSVISPAKRPLPPLPTSTSTPRFPDHGSETYEEVRSTIATSRIPEELPTLRPPLPPSQESRINRPPEPEPKIKPAPKTDDSGEVDFRSVLRSSIAAKQKELKARPSGSPPRPPTKPGGAKPSFKSADTSAATPQTNNFKAALRPVKIPEKPNAPRPNGVAKPIGKPATSNTKKSFKPGSVQDEPPKLPPKPKPSLKNVTPVLRDNVQSSDDGAVVDFRSVLRSTQRKQSAGSNGVGRSKSFNSDKLIATKTKTQQNKPPSVPKKPPNLPLKPRLPAKMKGLDGPDGAANGEKTAGTRPPWRTASKPVLQRFQSNNSNSNVNTSEKKPVFTVGRVEIDLNPPQELGAIFMKRGSPDGQVDDKFAESTTDDKPPSVVPPERLKKFTKDAKKLQGLNFKAVTEKPQGVECLDPEDKLYIAVSDYEGLEECEVSFRLGDAAEILEKSENNWWYVKIDGKTGWAPSSFFGYDTPESGNSDPQSDETQKCEVFPSESEVSSESAARFPADYRAAADFVAEEASMLSLTTGDVVTVMQAADGGWWFGVLEDGSGEGWVPSTYLDPM